MCFLPGGDNSLTKKKKKRKEKKRKEKKKFSDHACVNNMGKAGRILGCIKVTHSPSPQ